MPTWFTAVAAGLIIWFGLEATAAGFVQSGVTIGLELGYAANTLGAFVAILVSVILVRRSVRRDGSPPPTSATHPVKPQPIVTVPAAHALQVSAKDHVREHQALEREVRRSAEPRTSMPNEKPTSLARLRFALLALAAIGAIGVGIFREDLARLVSDFAERGSREQLNYAQSTETPRAESELLLTPPGRRLSVSPTAPLVSLDDLLSEYLENEFAAAAKYEGRCSAGFFEDLCPGVEIAGTILEMGRDGQGVAFITLGRPAFSSSEIRARFDNTQIQSLQNLRRGQSVSVRCRVSYESAKGAAGIRLTSCTVLPA